MTENCAKNMSDLVLDVCESDFPIAPHLVEKRTAVALLIGTEGPSYRSPGAAMAIDEDGKSWGSLSSGCIEQDIVLQAQKAMASGEEKTLRYGMGSPFMDLILPCGGGMDVRILPMPDRASLQRAAGQLAQRQAKSLELADGLNVVIHPELRFIVFGNGPEARCFSSLAHTTGYEVELYSTEPETVHGFDFGHELNLARWPSGVSVDSRSAVVLFFHDHDYEPPLLKAALDSPAYFVGAQGSHRAYRLRCEELAKLGVSSMEMKRLEPRFGLIPSVRNPRSLAVSVLAHLIERAPPLRGEAPPKLSWNQG